MVVLRALCVLMVLSGIAGVAAGEEVAAGGWWLIVVFSGLLALTFVRHEGRPAVGSRVVTIGAAIMTILIVVPVVLLPVAGGG